MTLNAAFWLSLVLACTGWTGLWLAGRGAWRGWALGLAAQPVWAAFALITHAYGLLISCLIYGSAYAHNLQQWRRQRPMLVQLSPEPLEA